MATPLGKSADPEVLFTRLEKIGKGSFGEVFKGIDNQNKEVLAFKIIDLEEAEDEIEDIQQEITILSQCDSAHVTRYYGSYLKADVWSLGITAIELAQGQPPHADLHPMRVLFLIPKSNPPELLGNYSKSFKEFIALCLNKDPKNRPSARDLLRHKFIKHAKKTSCLVDLIDRYKRWKASGENSDSDSEDTSRSKVHRGDDDTTDPPDWKFDTVRETSTSEAPRLFNKEETSPVPVPVPTPPAPVSNGPINGLSTNLTSNDDERVSDPDSRLSDQSMEGVEPVRPVEPVIPVIDRIIHPVMNRLKSEGFEGGGSGNSPEREVSSPDRWSNLAIEELERAFELLESSNPGFSEIFIKCLVTQLQRRSM
uniref:non-specific serine/threonine protein kinase n=1 Tax=Amphimedon queenslandica TaxID=400682 RepID=A0A1X7TS83_AMPQE